MRTGSCQCQSVRYELTDNLFQHCYCCCSICRRLTGSAMGAYGAIARKHFRWLTGEDDTRAYQQNEHLQRVFCSNCGSFLLSVHALDTVNCYVSLGCLDSGENINIEYYQYAGSKAAWLDLNCKIECHEEWPNDDWPNE